MIIDDAHRVAFLHIPKCGGTSVRRQLKANDSYAGFFYDRKTHEELGLIDYCHLPLHFLRSHFPEAFEKVVAYQAFAIARDPHARFASATFERLALFTGVQQTRATAAIAIEEARRVMRWLETREAPFCDAGFIHFARQVDYVRLDGQILVENVYALDDMAGFGAHLGALCDVTFDPERKDNMNFASPTGLVAFLHRAKPLYSRLTSWDQRVAILKLLRRLKLQSPDSIYGQFREHPEISAFVRDYYADDFALHASAATRARGGHAAAPAAA